MELLERPVRLGRPEAHVGVEALDPTLGVLLLPLDPVIGTRVPEVLMAVDDEVLLAILLVHALSSRTVVGPLYSRERDGIQDVGGASVVRILRRREVPVDQFDAVTVGVGDEADAADLGSAAGRVRRPLGFDPLARQLGE